MNGDDVTMHGVHGPRPGGLASAARRGLVLVGLVGLMLALMTQPLDAQDDQEVPDRVVIFVLDLSGSMNESFGDGQTKLEVAKQSFAEAFGNVRDDARVGLRVYGDQFPPAPPAQRERNCAEDTRVLVPPGPLERDELIQQVEGFEATGDTPIALALRAANNDLPDGVLGTIVLFSDGRDECFDADLDGDAATGPSFGEDPCVVAGEIAGDGRDLRIDRIETVGFGADAAAESELRCIADTTGGSYTPVTSPEDARAVLPELLATFGSPREAQRLGGTPIDGTPVQDGAPDVARADVAGNQGRYTDQIDMNSEKWYRTPDFGPEAGTFTATVFGLPAQEGITFNLRAHLPATDQSFFDNYANTNAGVPRRPTAFVRCPGCSVSGGPHEMFWVVSLSSENPDLGGTYDLELLFEGAGFGGADEACLEPSACWYEQQLAQVNERIAELEAELESRGGAVGDEDLIAERDALADQASDLQDSVEATRATRDALAAESSDGAGDTGSPLVPLAIGVFGLGAGGAALTRRRHAGDDGPDVTQSIDSAEEPSVVPAASAGVVGQVVDDGPAGDDVDDTGADAEAAPAAGWYADPHEDGVLRWWDGQAWSSHTRGDESGSAQ